MKKYAALPQQKKLRDLAQKLGRTEGKLRNAKKKFQENKRAQFEKYRRHARKTRWWHWVGLFIVGSVEWLINYNSFVEAYGVPAFAIGMTALVAGIVAFASHEHGRILRQPYLMEEFQYGRDSRSGRLVICVLSIVGLVFALVMVGWSRYVWFDDLSALGVEIAVWPRVAIALMANVIVWILGCAVSWKAHSEGYYTPLQRDHDRAKAKHLKAKQKMDALTNRLIHRLSPEQKTEMENLIEEEREKVHSKGHSDTRPQGSRVTTAAVFACVAVALTVVDAEAQVLSSEYDISQFCEDATVAEAQPFRKTVVYIDESMVRPQQADPPPSSDAELDRWQEEVTAALARADWYGQLEAKLQASLLPSEEVEVVSIAANGTPRERSSFCWPGYTDAQLAGIRDASLFERLLRSDPEDNLATQRIAFFGRIRRGLAEALSQDPSGGPSTRYVRALSLDEGRLRTTEDAFVRVIWYGHMMEDAEHGSIHDASNIMDATAMARRAVERSSLRLGGASFYIYGVEDEDRVRAFWDELFLSAGGQLAAFGPDLALTAKTPRRLARLLLDIETGTAGNRQARATLLAAEDGELLDSALVVEGTFRSVLQGTFECEVPEDAGNLCAADCVLDAQTRRTVLYETMSEETLEASGSGADLSGYIGQRDDRSESSRAYTPVVGSVEGCGI